MNILTISNFYPPHHIGGYGMLCWEVVNALMARGHRVQVLAGMHGVDGPVVEEHIHRVLTLESDLYYYHPQSAVGYPKVKAKNLAILRQMVEEEQPDVIFIWGMWALTKELAGAAERLLPGRVVYYLANPWPIDPNLHRAYWEMPATSAPRRLFKSLMHLPARLWLHAEWQPFDLQYEHVLCCSAALRDQMLDANVPLQNAPVIYEGIELDPYLTQSTKRVTRWVATAEMLQSRIAEVDAQVAKPTPAGRINTNGHGNSYQNGIVQQPLVTTVVGLPATRVPVADIPADQALAQPTAPPEKFALLFVGTLAEHKGVHTTIEALGKLSSEERERFHLTILGSGHPHYEARLRQLAADEQVEACVTFHTPVPRHELPDFLGEHDVLLLPSIWEEPLARIMQEGLASGLVVVGAATGGTAEIIRDGENGLLFPAAATNALAAKLRTLLLDPTLFSRLATAGQQTASKLFALPRMVDDIESYLVNLYAATLSH